MSFGEHYDFKRLSVHSTATHRLTNIRRDPRFIREFKAKHCVEVFVEDQRTKRK